MPTLATVTGAPDSERDGDGPGEDLPIIEAAGGVVLRTEHSRPLVLLVHRPAYDDWSFPKGKLDESDRSLESCAHREVFEETGVRTVPGVPVGESWYRVVTKKGKPARKHVTYWLMRSATDAPGTFRPNDEVDAIRWVDVTVAPSVLSYDRDRDILAAAVELLDREPLSAVSALRGPELTHLALGVADLDTSVSFYEDFCGMVKIHERRDGDVRVAWLGDPAAIPEPDQPGAGAGPGEDPARSRGFVLVLAEGLPPNPPLGPFAHLGFSVSSHDEVDLLAGRGRERGILALEPTDEGPVVGYICEVVDPDGNICEFSHGQSLGRHAPPA